MDLKSIVSLMLIHQSRRRKVRTIPNALAGDGHSSFRSLAPPLPTKPAYPQGARRIRKAASCRRLRSRWASIGDPFAHWLRMTNLNVQSL